MKNRAWVGVGVGIVIGWCLNWAASGRYFIVDAADGPPVLIDRWTGKTWTVYEKFEWHLAETAK